MPANKIKIGNRVFYSAMRSHTGRRWIDGKPVEFTMFNTLSYGGANYLITVFADGYGEAFSTGNHKRYSGRVE